ncbi:hypothetical protein NPIL_459701 [Nephila pilipes]|uniref:Uncharacterized protein n=1 Tax=Nephila pilipes TaxID=299642 RepID=A0A8X6QWA1_NEPPI|nr:hypothetical protein NPIL_459701 [Nephila pilipes]
MKIETFQQLKGLMVTEQFRVPLDVREHDLENWLKFTTPLDLAEKLDGYESIRESFKKEDPPKRNFANFRGQNGNHHYFKLIENTKDFFFSSQNFQKIRNIEGQT